MKFCWQLILASLLLSGCFDLDASSDKDAGNDIVTDLESDSDSDTQTETGSNPDSETGSNPDTETGSNPDTETGSNPDTQLDIIWAESFAGGGESSITDESAGTESGKMWMTIGSPPLGPEPSENLPDVKMYWGFQSAIAQFSDF